MSTPQVVVLGGPNGAGKSTLAPYLLRDALGLTTFVNADEIARGLSGFAPEAAAVRAGRIMLRRLDELSVQQANFAFESTLAGLTARDVIHRCRDIGYEVHLFYLWLPAPELAIARVRQRVRAGGHDIPERDVRRRWARSVRNLFDEYIPLADTWSMLDGSAARLAPVIAQGSMGQPITVINSERWQEVSGVVRVLRGPRRQL